MRTLTCNLLKAVITLAAFGLAATQSAGQSPDGDSALSTNYSPIHLPKVREDGKTSVESALAARRSIRSFANMPVSLQELSQLLWAAQGLTHANGFRTAPSAGALYPLEVSAIVGLVEGLPAGIYRYQPAGHLLYKITKLRQGIDATPWRMLP